MRAIVTGGAGFIGSYLCEELVENEYEISIIDNLFRGKYENIKHLMNKRNKFYELDLAIKENVERVVTILVEERPQLIFHYAAINGTQYFYDIPSKVLDVNSMATYYLMLATKQAKLRCAEFNPKIIYASSSEVYGEPFTLPTKETDVTYVNVNEVRDSYAIAKLVGEFYVKLMCEEVNLDWIVLRLFNVYGTRMVGTKYGQVIPEFINRLSNGEYPLNIFGNGEHMRSFCYVTDNVKYTVRLAMSTVKNEVFNIGNDHEISIKDLATIIMEKMGLEPDFNFLEERSGDHKRRCPDTRKLNAAIGTDIYVSIYDGIDKMLKEK